MNSVYSYNKLHSIKNKKPIDTCSNSDESSTHNAEWKKKNRHERIYMGWFHSYESLEKAHLIYSDRCEVGVLSRQKEGCCGRGEGVRWVADYMVCSEESVHWAVLVRLAYTLLSSGCCSVPKSCLTLCNPMNCSTPGFLIPHHLPEFAQE